MHKDEDVNALAVKVRNLTKEYSDGKNVTKVLKGIDVEIKKRHARFRAVPP